MQVLKASPTSKSYSMITMKQLVTLTLKTISTVITGYDPEVKDNICEITVYDILSRWI